MGNFDASLKTIGDRKGLDVTVHLDGGRLAIDAGDEAIGDWSLDEIRLEPIPTGYRMSAEGDQILLELTDIEGFESELNSKKKRGRSKKVKEETTRRPKGRAKPEKAAPEKPEKAKRDKPEKEPRQKREKTPRKAHKNAEAPTPVAEDDPSAATDAGTGVETERSDSATARFVERLDGTLEAAEKRWGALLPPWIFTRVTALVLFTVFVLMVIFPTWVSTFLLLAGLLIVVLGAIVYTDPMLGAKWLPGRMQPPHVLVFGVAVLLFGVLLGVIAT